MSASDLFAQSAAEKAYDASTIEVLDNAMDEAVAGHASRIEVELFADGLLAVTDNGRGIPVDPHPRFPKISALEVIRLAPPPPNGTPAPRS